MQSADLGNFDHLTERGWFDGSANRRVFFEGQVCSMILVVLQIVFQDATQPDFMKDEDVVQTFTPNGADQPLDVSVLPRAAGRGQNFLNAHIFGCLVKLVPITTVAVVQKISGRSVPREGLEKLPCGPFCSRIGGHCEVKRTTTVMVENQEDEEELEGYGWDDEKVHGN